MAPCLGESLRFCQPGCKIVALESDRDAVLTAGLGTACVWVVLFFGEECF